MVYESYQEEDEVVLTCLDVHFPVIAAYEDVSFAEENEEEEEADWERE